MKKAFMLFVFVLFASSMVFGSQPVNVIFGAQEDTVAYWRPAEPKPGDVITIYYNDIPGTLPDGGDKTVKMHWGINESTHGNWKQPPEIIWPAESTPWSDGKAIQSPMTRNAQNLWELQITTLDTIKSIHWVFTNGSAWDNNAGMNWDLFLENAPVAPEHTDTLTVNFLVDMAQAIVNRGFTYGDKLEVQAGFFTTAKEVVTTELQRQGFTSYYAGSAQIVTTIDSLIDYHYVAYPDDQENVETYYNFEYTGDVQGEAQRRQIKATDFMMSVADTVFSTSHSRRMPFFRNLSRLSQDVLVTYTCDLRPAIYQVLTGSVLEDIQGEVNVTDADSILKWGVAINGPATGSWSNTLGPDWGIHLMTLPEKRMYDDGTNGDVVAGDSIFTIQFQYSKDSTAHTIGMEFKFGIKGGDNEGGYGNNHVANIDDALETYTLHSQFGSLDPVFYRAWDFDKQQPATAVNGFTTKKPVEFALQQNYPNPFNPTTKINYRLGQSGKVKLTIYNILGEEIRTLVNQSQTVGTHNAIWDGRNNLGQLVGTGIYVYKIETADFVQSRKMLLIK